MCFERRCCCGDNLSVTSLLSKEDVSDIHGGLVLLSFVIPPSWAVYVFLQISKVFYF